MNTLWLIAYDIKDTRIRTAVADILANYGERVQYSVFECYLSLGEFSRLRQDITSIIDKQDALRFYPLCQWCRQNIEIQGKGNYTMDKEFFIA